MNEANKKPKSTYESAGVSIDKGTQLVEQVKACAKSTHIPGVLTGLGGFGALFELTQHTCKNPVLVAGTDGVGTKIKLAIQSGRHDTIGIDLVAMCVNDLLVQGAKPLFFLDYLACSTLDVETAAIVINGIAEGCRRAGCALIGGETAEMPGMYTDGDYDLAGFCVGIVDKEKIIDGSHVNAGDVLLGLTSSGLHSNGYSLVRKIFSDNNLDYHRKLGGKTLIDLLLEPTRIYAASINSLLKKVQIHAMAHITGGGLVENVPRVLPLGLQAEIGPNAWQQPEIFSWLQEKGNIENREMYRTFNCGIGMVICIDPGDINMTRDILSSAGESVMEIGTIINKSSPEDPTVVIK